MRDLEALQRDTGVAGEVDVLIEGADLTEPKVMAWMRGYQSELLARHGYNAQKGCAGAELCPALSLPDLFRTPELSATREQIRALLDAVPPYFSQAAITPDRKTALLAFGLRLQSLEAQHEVIEDMRGRLDPPAGVRATVAGLPVLAADANHALSDPLRRLLTALAGLAAVALALFAVYRSWTRAWVPLVPIALATGWSALVLWLIGVPLNPMSAALERAGDRDLDRVLGAPDARATAPSARTAPTRPTRWRAPTPRPAPPCSPPASPRSPASPS